METVKNLCRVFLCPVADSREVSDQAKNEMRRIEMIRPILNEV